MVAIISTDMQKEAPVVVAQEMAEPRSTKRHVILTSWASVATALLIMMFIGGAFYVADLKGRECKTPVQTSNSNSGQNSRDYSRTYNKDGEKTREDFHVDPDDQSELIIKKNAEGNIEMITGVDYKRKISATYLPADDMCLLLAGADMDMADDWSGEKNETVNVSDDNIKKETYTVTDNKVSDLSILPKVMKPYCQGKPTYWAQETDGSELESEGDRHKRGICRRWRCYYLGRFGGRHYWRCFFIGYVRC